VVACATAFAQAEFDRIGAPVQHVPFGVDLDKLDRAAAAALVVEQPAHPGLLELRSDQVEPGPGVAVRGRGRGYRHPVEQVRAQHHEVADESTRDFLKRYMAEFRDHVVRVLTVLPRRAAEA
jgi:hypothetical protein